MVQEVTIPTGALNNIPGVSGVSDVDFQVPEVEDIREELVDALPTEEDIRRLVREEVRGLLEDPPVLDPFLDNLVDPILEELDDQLQADILDTEEIADLVADRVGAVEVGDLTVDIEGSLFSIQDDFVDILAAALATADLGEVSGFPSLEDIQELLEEETADLGELDVPDLEDIRGEVQEAVEDALEELLPGFLFNPLEETAEELASLIQERLVSEEARQELVDVLEEGE